MKYKYITNILNHYVSEIATHLFYILVSLKYIFD